MEKKRNRKWAMALVVISFCFYAGIVSAAEKVVKLGLLLPLTGQAAPVAEFVRMGNELAVA
ncbi:MAG: hypothetical protein HY879_17715, partial [Deltaproteobacteria bacterium]|nr:hypothetical protein [Deltaproteobacteria bacterium]